MAITSTEELRRVYQRDKAGTRARLDRYKKFGQMASRDQLLAKLAYCICTPQTRYEHCEAAVHELEKKGLLSWAPEDVLAVVLKRNHVRFYNQKAERIVKARSRFYDSSREIDIRDMVNGLLRSPQREARSVLWDKNIGGLGMKESSHFLRDVGHGEDLAILDSHILSGVKELGGVKSLPKTLTHTRYVSLEQEIGKWCESLGMTLGEMDILLWSDAVSPP